jgi:transcriptional regulator with XRE-family HTH domain
MLDVGQSKLAEALGMTFQQVQKYEKGETRVSASRLLQISNHLQVSISILFQGSTRHPRMHPRKLTHPTPITFPTFSRRPTGNHSFRPSSK